jgi:hypothetical protein
MYAVTDAFSGLYGTYDTPGTGANFLVHNMCRMQGFVLQPMFLNVKII